MSHRLTLPAPLRWFASLVGVVALVGGALALLPASSQAAGDCTVAASDSAIDSEEQAFLNLLNTYRQQNGLATLALSPGAGRAAAWMSRDLAAKRYFSHTDSLGRDPWTRMADCGYAFNTWKGENIAAGYADAASTFNQWKNSSGHNANMLGANFRVAGIARAYDAGAPYRWYWTLDLGGFVDGSGGTVTATATATATATRTPTVVPTATATTTPNPSAPPSAPTNLRRGAVTATSVQALWTDTANNESTFQVAYRLSTATSWTFVNLGANTTSYTIAGAQPGRTDYVFVRACNSVGCSPWNYGIAITTPTQ